MVINIGHGHLVARNKIVSIMRIDSSPMRRHIRQAKDTGLAIDCTQGERTQAIILTDSEHVFLSPLTAQELGGRLNESAE